MIFSGERFSTNVTRVFDLQMDSFNVSLHVFFGSLKLADVALNFGFFVEKFDVISQTVFSVCLKVTLFTLVNLSLVLMHVFDVSLQSNGRG